MNQPKPIKHGTYSGWMQHQKQDIPACIACREANRQHQNEWRSRPGNSAKHLRRVKARKLAQQELAKRHEKEFRQLYKFYVTQLEWLAAMEENHEP